MKSLEIVAVLISLSGLKMKLLRKAAAIVGTLWAMQTYPEMGEGAEEIKGSQL